MAIEPKRAGGGDAARRDRRVRTVLPRAWLLPLAMLSAVACPVEDCDDRGNPVVSRTPPVDSLVVSVTPALTELRVGQTRTLTSQVRGGAAATAGVVWSAEPATVVSLTGSGTTVEVLALAPGTATVTAIHVSGAGTPGASTVVVLP